MGFRAVARQTVYRKALAWRGDGAAVVLALSGHRVGD